MRMTPSRTWPTPLVITALLCLSILSSPSTGFLPSPPLNHTPITTTTSCPNRDPAPSKTFLSSSSSDDDDEFMTSLRTRVTEVTSRASYLPLVVLDAMLPRQTLDLTGIRNEALVELIRRRIGGETPTLGMLGTARLASGETVRLRSGVEVEILGRPSMGSGGDGESVRLRGGRRFVVEGGVETVGGGWTEAKVRFLDDDDDDGGKVDPTSIARAVAKSLEFTAPNMSMKDGLSLVERWIELARERERTTGQIDELVASLGEIPSKDKPSERAFWVGALINPLPAMGVAMEVRPSLLVAEGAEERVDVALDGLFRSIRHMDGSDPMW